MTLSRSRRDPFIGKLTPLDPKLEPLRIVGFDSEDNTKGVPICFTFHDGVNSFYTRFADEAIDYIYDAEETTCFVAHNLEYDIGNLFKACDFKYVKEMVYASRLLQVSLHATKNHFLNTSSFFAGSLAGMGKLVGVEKHDASPFSRDYPIRDALIPQVFMSSFQKRLHQEGVNLGVSIGQIAMASFRRNFLPSPIKTFNHPDVLKSYFGGRVEMFYKGVVKEKVYVADIRSSYPDVMERMPYPDTGTVEVSRIDTHDFGVGEFSIRVPSSLFIPPLPYRSESGRLFFPVGDIHKRHFTYAEVRKAVSMGCTILDESPGFGTNVSIHPFRDFVGENWDARQVAEKTKETDAAAAFEVFYLKLKMNNLYGKFAQHKPKTITQRFRMPLWQRLKNNVTRESKMGPLWNYVMERKSAPKTANYLWGVYVTAYARLSLLEKLLAVHAAGGRLLYCDTDSIMFTGDGAVAALTIGKKLGQMSLETFDLAVFRQSKGYLLCDAQEKARNIHSKGKLFHKGAHAGTVPRKATRPSTYTEYTVKKVACKGVPTDYALEFIKTGLAATIRKPFRLKEALIRANSKSASELEEEVGVNIWADAEKAMHSVYIKRKGESGVTTPIDVLDIPQAEMDSTTDTHRFKEMDGLDIRQEKRRKEWDFVKIPRRWFDAKRRLHHPKEKLSEEVHYFRFEELLEIKPSDVWFSGRVIRTEQGKYSSFYILRLQKFLGENVSNKNFTAALPIKFLGDIAEEKIMHKRLEIILNSSYNGEAFPDISARVG